MARFELPETTRIVIVGGDPDWPGDAPTQAELEASAELPDTETLDEITGYQVVATAPDAVPGEWTIRGPYLDAFEAYLEAFEPYLEASTAAQPLDVDPDGGSWTPPEGEITSHDYHCHLNEHGREALNEWLAGHDIDYNQVETVRYTTEGSTVVMYELNADGRRHVREGETEAARVIVMVAEPPPRLALFNTRPGMCGTCTAEELREESEAHRQARRARSTPELLARLDAVLDDPTAGQTATDGPLYHDLRGEGLLPTRPQPAAPEVDNPIRRGPEDTAWLKVAERAWADLTGETELPGWFDELATIGEVARRSGHTRAEVKAAIDLARYGPDDGEYPAGSPMLWYRDDWQPLTYHFVVDCRTEARGRAVRAAGVPAWMIQEADQVAAVFDAGRQFSSELSRVAALFDSIDAHEWLNTLASDLGGDLVDNIDGSRSLNFDFVDIGDITATIRGVTDRLLNAEQIAQVAAQFGPLGVAVDDVTNALTRMIELPDIAPILATRAQAALPMHTEGNRAQRRGHRDRPGHVSPHGPTPRGRRSP